MTPFLWSGFTAYKQQAACMVISLPQPSPSPIYMRHQNRMIRWRNPIWRDFKKYHIHNTIHVCTYQRGCQKIYWTRQLFLLTNKIIYYCYMPFCNNYLLGLASNKLLPINNWPYIYGEFFFYFFLKLKDHIWIC